jgi:hypothetical protein
MVTVDRFSYFEGPSWAEGRRGRFKPAAMIRDPRGAYRVREPFATVRQGGAEWRAFVGDNSGGRALIFDTAREAYRWAAAELRRQCRPRQGFPGAIS